jgi:hypothetical protein
MKMEAQFYTLSGKKYMHTIVNMTFCLKKKHLKLLAEATRFPHPPLCVRRKE